MIRYRLDDLGWFQFEWLVQALLKTELGLAIESWGGTADRGRDAYCRTALPFPSREVVSQGPFLFQAKFVEGANAAGASPGPALLKAVRAECERIKKRVASGQWEPPRQYFLLTNAPLTAALRLQLELALSQVILAPSAVNLRGGTDICDLLDGHGEVRRSFPQLLGLRDLDELLGSVVRAEAINKSRLAIEAARDLAKVFVPTAAYEKALRVLHKHSFVVLEGPPEMGKSAIAWMISLLQVSLEWEAVVCDRPEELLAEYRPERKQVFVADDAFGRTEYDVTRSTQWERQIERVLQVVDSKHWLLWTSRKHILQRAKRELDLQGRAAHFPNPAEVLVDASQLTPQERALILYRHARAHVSTPDEAEVVRGFAAAAVANAAFTPERIRRLVSERLPELVQKASGPNGRANVITEVGEAIRNPTPRMRKSFRRLPIAHKWVLICVLECGAWPEPRRVRERYLQTVPSDAKGTFEQNLEELFESFVKPSGSVVAWTHPSYRDLVIEELMQDVSLREAFLKQMTLDGFKLTLSGAGGASGQRRLPLMVDAKSWELLDERLVSYIPDAEPQSVSEILQVLTSAIQDYGGEHAGSLKAILKTACNVAKAHWDASRATLTGEQLRAYAEATVHLTALAPMPDLEVSWAAAEARLESQQDADDALDADTLDEWSRFLEVVTEAEPRLLTAKRFPASREGQLEALFDRCRDELDYSNDFDSSADMRAEAARLNSLANTVARLGNLGFEREQAIDLARQIRSKAGTLEDRANSEDDDEYESEARDTGKVFDVAALFRDL